MNIDFEKLANAGVKLIRAAGTHPMGAAIIVAGTLGAWALWLFGPK